VAVALDAKSEFSASKDGLTSTTDATFTVGAGSNRALVVALCTESVTGSAPTAPTCRWDSTGTNQSMTLITTMSDNRDTHDCKIFLFGLVAPTSGLKTLDISGCNANTDFVFAYISFTGVDQTGGTTTFKNAITNGVANGTAITATVTTNVNDGSVCSFGGNNGAPTVNQTAWNVEALTTFSTNYQKGCYAIASGTSVAHTLTQTIANANYAAMAINQFTAASASNPLMPQIWI
jgi:hypothetical protein